MHFIEALDDKCANSKQQKHTDAQKRKEEIWKDFIPTCYFQNLKDAEHVFQ